MALFVIRGGFIRGVSKKVPEPGDSHSTARSRHTRRSVEAKLKAHTTAPNHSATWAPPLCEAKTRMVCATDAEK